MRRGIKLSERSPKLVIAKMAAASRTANKNQQKSTNKTSNSSDACWERALVVSVAAIAVANSHNQDRQSHVTNLYVFTQVKGNFKTAHGPISYCQDGHCLQSGQQESVEKAAERSLTLVMLWLTGRSTHLNSYKAFQGRDRSPLHRGKHELQGARPGITYCSLIKPSGDTIPWK